MRRPRRIRSFSAQSQFSGDFKRLVAVTPGRFRTPARSYKSVASLAKKPDSQLLAFRMWMSALAIPEVAGRQIAHGTCRSRCRDPGGSCAPGSAIGSGDETNDAGTMATDWRDLRRHPPDWPDRSRAPAP